MKLLDWLLDGDEAIKRLTDCHILNQSRAYQESGIVTAYLDLFDPNTMMWGKGVYGPKWISTTYTLLELIYMEVNPNHPYMIQATKKTIQTLWPHKGPYKNKRFLDLCIAGLLVKFASYTKVEEDKLYEIVDYILEHSFADGGWNCCFDSPTHSPKTSSLHTTINVLEGFHTYLANHYEYKASEIKVQMARAHEFMLQKNLFRSRRTNQIIHSDMMEFHYPTRWKYDCVRALEYFADEKVSYDKRMEEALNIVKSSINKGIVGKGKKYSGLIHFELEPYKGSRFNTYRALKIVKYFDNSMFHNLINRHFL
jgi:hypothetical protein